MDLARGSLPFMGMIMVVLVQTSNMVVTKMAMSDGMNKYTMVFYSNALSSLVLLPCPLIISRRPGSCPPLTFSVLRKIFLIALIGLACQMCEYVGMDYSSPVLGMAMMNLIPAFTFILAIISRMEKVNWKSSSSQAKLVGTITSILGAFVVTLYKGPPIGLLMELIIRMEKVNWKSSSSQAKLVGTITSILGAFVVTLYKGPPILLSPSPPPVQPPHLLFLLSRQSNWILGGFLLVAEAFLISLWFIGQAFILKDYPVVMNLMFYSTFFSTVLSGLLSFVTVRDPQFWILKVNIGLISILYSALVSGVFRASLCTWCLKKTGPVYVSMFKPLGVVFAAGLGFIFLGEKLYLGSIIGAIVIVMGFYGVMWGKSKEEETTIEGSGVGESLASSVHKTPLLQNKASSV